MFTGNVCMIIQKSYQTPFESHHIDKSVTVCVFSSFLLPSLLFYCTDGMISSPLQSWAMRTPANQC